MADGDETARLELAEAFVAHALGESSVEETRTRIATIAARASLDADVRVLRMLARLRNDDAVQKRRQKRFHDARNALAGVIATVELLAAVLQHESPEHPFLTQATPATRREVLEALRHATDATKSLSTILQLPFDDDSK